MKLELLQQLIRLNESFIRHDRVEVISGPHAKKTGVVAATSKIGSSLVLVHFDDDANDSEDWIELKNLKKVPINVRWGLKGI